MAIRDEHRLGIRSGLPASMCNRRFGGRGVKHNVLVSSRQPTRPMRPPQIKREADRSAPAPNKMVATVLVKAECPCSDLGRTAYTSAKSILPAATIIHDHRLSENMAGPDFSYRFESTTY